MAAQTQHNKLFEKINLVIGIDQTGALKNKKQAKALPIVLLEKTKNQTWRLIGKSSSNQELKLQSLYPDYMKQLIHTHCLHAYDDCHMLFAVDAVFGLPFVEDSKMKGNAAFMKDFFTQAKNMDGYGLKIGRLFFDTLFKTYYSHKAQYPKRVYETSLNANSVFTTTPAQKNVQTGTFRIWKDLGQWASNSYQLWPFEPKTLSPGIPAIFEAYPSLAWSILNESNRQSTDLTKTKDKLEPIVENIDDILAYSPDHKDAAFIALLTLWYCQQKISFHPDTVSIEGHILGANYQGIGEASQE